MPRTRVLAVLIALLALPVVAKADTFGLTDPSGAGAGTNYTLDFNPACTVGCSATLAIDTSTNSGWFIDWFLLKIANAGTGQNTLFSIATAPSSDWNVNNNSSSPSVVHNAGPQDTGSFTLPDNGFSAFYVSGILFSNNPAIIGQGVALNGGQAIFTFGYNLFPGTSSIGFLPHLRVGYYSNAANGNLGFNQLSEDFSAPEPSGLALFGLGLIVIAGLLRFRASRAAHS